MYDLQKEAEVCLKMVSDLGIEPGIIQEFKINTRNNNKWGSCKRRYETVGSTQIAIFTISISSVLLDESVDLKTGLRNTLIHEILHTVDGCKGHTGKWKRLAETVNRTYGYDIKRCNSSEEKGVSQELVEKAKKPKHEIICNGCGRVYFRYKESKFTTNYDRYRCGECGGSFSKLF